MAKKSIIIVYFILATVFLSACSLVQKDVVRQAPAAVPDDMQDSTSYSLYVLAEIYRQKEDYQGALPYLKKAIELDPEADFLKKELISLYLLLKDKDKALEVAQDLVNKSPDDTDGLMILAKLKQFIKQDQDAREIYKKILQLNPDNENIYMILGRQYMESDMIDEAFSLYTKMASHFPESYVAHFFLGRIHIKKQNPDYAEKEFKKSIQLNPELVEPRFELVQLYRGKETEKSVLNPDIIKLYGEILEIEPSNIRADLELALYYHNHGETVEAGSRFARIGLETTDKPDMIMLVAREFIGNERYKDASIVFPGMLRGAPEDSTLNYLAGVAFDALKETKNALFHFSKVKPSSDYYKKSVIHMAFLYNEEGDREKAIQFLEDRNEELPLDVDIMMYLASFYEDAERYEDAISLLNTGLQQVKDQGALMFKLGIVQDKAGMKDKCIETMKRVIELEPKNATALNYLGYTYAEMGENLDQAEKLITRALAEKPDDGFITDSLGWVYFKLQQYDKAIPILEKAVELSSSDPVIVEHLGDAYLKTDQLAKALEAYKKARAAIKEDKPLLHQKIKDLEKRIHE
ncbi:MAG: tetratricopeptide repeat protein [Pseudomonadota bacterium]